MAHKSSGRPRSKGEEPSLRPTRRQFVHGLSGALAGVSWGCSSTPQTGAFDAGRDVGEGGGTGGGATGGNTGGSAQGGRTGGATQGGRAGGGGHPESRTGGAGGSPSGKGGGAGGQSTGGNSGSSRKTAADQVLLGNTGITVSRLALGSGSNGTGGQSQQSRLGIAGFANVLVHGYDQGLTFFETADAYGSHPHIAEAIKRVGRKNVVIMTKTRAETEAGVQADLARFRTELGIDTIDIVLLHLKTSANWVNQCEGGMNALAKAKKSGAIRAHGVSCHSLTALQLAAQTSWVDVNLSRINQAGVQMDSTDPATIIKVLRQMKSAGQAVIGMKILGAGALANQLDASIAHAVGLDALDAFTIGFTSTAQMDQVVQKIATV